MSGDRSGAPPDLVGPDLERPWPGSCACSTPTPLGVLGPAVDARTERWTEPAERRHDHGHRAHGGHSDLFPVRHCPRRRRRHGPVAGRRARTDPTLSAERRSSSPGRGRAVARWFATGRDRNDAAPGRAPLARRPIRLQLAPTSHREPGSESLGPSRAPEPPAGIRPVGPPTAKGGCLVPCPVSVLRLRSWRPLPRASC
jgi:hypothetical protein